MHAPAPQVPFGRLQCTGRDPIRSMVARQVDWARQMAFHTDASGTLLRPVSYTHLTLPTTPYV